MGAEEQPRDDDGKFASTGGTKRDARAWAERVGSAKKDSASHVMVERTPSGQRLTTFSTKKAAHAAGQALRTKGGDVAVYSVGDYKKFIDPAWSAK
jgi:hypothetical protein